MTITLPIETLFYIIEPIISDIIKDIIISGTKNEELITIKEDLFTKLKDVTGRNHFFFDTDVCNAIRFIMNDVDSFKSYGSVILRSVSQWVASEDTQWDNTHLCPVFTTLMEIMLSKEDGWSNVDCDSFRAAIGVTKPEAPRPMWGIDPKMLSDIESMDKFCGQC